LNDFLDYSQNRQYIESMKTFEYRLRPNRTQQTALMAMLVGTRKAYNDGLQELIDHYKETGKYLNYFVQDKLHNKIRHPNLPAVLVDTTLTRLHRSFANFFRGLKEGRKVGFPRFKGANRWHTIQFRDAGNCLDGRYFKAGKICGGQIRVVLHRPIEGKFRFARIVKRVSGWYLQCVCEIESKPFPLSKKKVGLDMGITYLVADSDGGFVRNPRHLIASASRLAKAQRKSDRCQPGSHRRRKAKRAVARIHESIANQRKDTLHKVARKYVNVYGIIVVEDLQPANMARNHAFARSILDSSWGMLRMLLTSKAEDAGRQLIAVPPHYTSQRCSRCGKMVPKSLSVRTHLCPHCGYLADRDTNAALNILQAGTPPSGRVGEGPSRDGESPGPSSREADKF
jgi:putative transposase